MDQLPPNHVLQEATYTEEYLKPNLHAGNIEAEQAWLQFLQNHRHLYFDVKAPLTQYDHYDLRPRYLSVKQLESAAASIEKSTAEVITLQKKLLHDWHRGAKCFQSAWRGYAARKSMRSFLWKARIRKVERLFKIIQGIRRLAKERSHRRVMRACWKIKWLVERAHICAKKIQRRVQMYLFKCRRWNAASKIERWYKHRVRNYYLTTALGRLHGFLKRKRRNILLDQYTTQALAARRNHRESRQAVYFSMKPEHVIVHRLVAERKQKLHEATAFRSRKSKQTSLERKHAVLPLPLASNTMMAQFYVAKSQSSM